MSDDTTRAVFYRIPNDVINARNLDRAGEVIEPDYVEHLPLPPGFPTGLVGFKTFWSALIEAFPDLHLTVEDVLIDGDKGVCRITATGTHEGDFMGIPATHRRATWSEMHLGRVENGKLVEHWGVIDQLGMLQQLGVIPQPEAAGV